MAGVAWLAAQVLGLWLVIPLAAVSYVGAVLLFRAFTGDELRQLGGLLRGKPALDQTSTPA